MKFFWDKFLYWSKSLSEIWLRIGNFTKITISCICACDFQNHFRISGAFCLPINNVLLVVKKQILNISA